MENLFQLEKQNGINYLCVWLQASENLVKELDF